MEEKYLVINAGSSSLKFSLYGMPSKNEIVNGYIERIGTKDSFYTIKYNGQVDEKKKEILTHSEAIKIMLSELLENKFINSISEIKGIGHRVLHGGEFYSDSVLIDDSVIKNIESLTKFGPLHHPGELAGIYGMKECLPDVPEVAIFDTAFHQTMPKENYMYATPYEWYSENGVRKYGFHGTSHKYITEEAKKIYGKDNVNLIICHIGSGASISCIKNGKSFDTTMGLTPLDGLVMGTRSGNIDPSILKYICDERNISLEEATSDLNKKSGLLGISGISSDFRDIETCAAEKNDRGVLAYNMIKNSIIKYIAEYYFELEGNVDAIIFTAGLGENAIGLREDIINSISKPMNIKLNKKENDIINRRKEKQSGRITTDDSLVDVLVLPTNEELMILNDTYKVSKEFQKGNEKVKVFHVNITF